MVGLLVCWREKWTAVMLGKSWENWLVDLWVLWLVDSRVDLLAGSWVAQSAG